MGKGSVPGPGWRQTSHGLWVVGPSSNDVEQRIIEQAARLGSAEAVTGWAALRLLGAAQCDGLAADGRTKLPVPLAVGPGGKLRPLDGSVISHTRLPAHDQLWCDGIWVTTVERATFDAMSAASDLVEAVVVLDIVLGAGMLTIDQLARWVQNRRDWKGVRRAREALVWARSGVRSPQETRLRMVVERDLGLPELAVNHVVFDERGYRIGEVDLLDIDAGVALEFDGADHRSAEAQTWDLAKQTALEDIDIVTVRFTSADVRRHSVVQQRVDAARARAIFALEQDRRWTVRPPVPYRNARFEQRMTAALRQAARLYGQRPS